MYIKQSELFRGTSMDFVKKFMDISEMSSHKKGEVLFSEKDPAKFFFILLNGCVKLSVGAPQQAVYNAARNGEAFGWSSLIGGEKQIPTMVLFSSNNLPPPWETGCLKRTK
jgi:signal-transduction protein with cAMP-binding, CBS, and nucleotidyltransferase domain